MQKSDMPQAGNISIYMLDFKGLYWRMTLKEELHYFHHSTGLNEEMALGDMRECLANWYHG